MSLLTQDNRQVKVFTELEDNVLLFSSISGVERLSHLFEYQLEMISEDHGIDLDGLVGTGITIELELPLGGYRYYNGVVSACGQAEPVNEHARYEYKIRPWTWLLTRTADCRIFQDISVPDIIKQIFAEEGFSDVEDSLTMDYAPCHYCVQYRETDFNFISRLMEQVGIYYFFKHENGAHKLVLCDSYSAHSTLENYTEVPYFPVTGGQIRERDHLSSWRIHKNLQPGSYVTNDFNFVDPGADLVVRDSAPGAHARSDYEVYDYPGEFPDRAAGEQVASLRMEEINVQQNSAYGAGSAQGLSAGQLFTLTNADRSDQNREYLIVESRSECRLENYQGSTAEDFSFRCEIQSIDSSQPFRAPQSTPKPLVQGPQTAIVVGPAGEEIWTDEHGRVKLQFHWDRYGSRNESSSCWVRVSQIWAGQGWGAMHIPRIGQEVIVEFLEGDPDRPIVTGRVYNADNRVPYDLPANATQSGIKSRSSQNGTANNFNEIRMEDKKGSEELYIQAEKNKRIKVKNNKSENVGANENISIGSNRTETVGKDETLTVKCNRTRTVEKNESVSVNGLRNHYVRLNEMINVVGAQEINVGGFQVLDVGLYQMTNIVGDQRITIGNHQIQTVCGNQEVSIQKNRTTEITEDEKISVQGTRETDITGDDSLTVGKVLKINAGDELVLESGASKIILKKDGKIQIIGTEVLVSNGPAKLELEKSGHAVLKGPMVRINS